MKASVTIRTDSLTICAGVVHEGKTALQILEASLHHETSAYQHLKDLPWANISIQVQPLMDVAPKAPKTLNQEAYGVA